MSVAVLCLFFLLPMSTIAGLIGREEFTNEFSPRRMREQREWDRLTAPLPPPRESVLPLDFYDTWPQRQTPSDSPPRVGLVIAEDRVGRHRAPEVVEAALVTPTGEFKALVAAGWTPEEQASLSREWWCECCLAGEHVDCGGLCACPCTLVASDV